MKRITVIIIALLSLLVPSISTRGQTTPGPGVRSSMIENLRAAGGFTELLRLVDRSGLSPTLSSRTQAVTFFALEDKALFKLPTGTLDSLLRDSAKSRAFLLPYIVSGLFNIDDLRNAASRHIPLHSLSGRPLSISTDATPKSYVLVTFNPCPTQAATPVTEKKEVGATCSDRIVSADHHTVNGIYHTIALTDGGIWR